MPVSSINKPDAALEQQLAEIRKKFEVNFEPLQVDGEPLQVLAINNMPKHIDKLLQNHKIRDPLKDLPLWAKVWPSSFVLGRFLRKFSPEGKSLLELGCGMGVCSLVAARYGFSKITASDLEPDALNFARANVMRNKLENRISICQVDAARHGADPRFIDGVDFIAASEILYLDELHRPLIKFIKRHLKAGGKAFFCTDLARAKPDFKKIASREFSVEEGKIGVKSQDEEGHEQRRIFNILILEKN